VMAALLSLPSVAATYNFDVIYSGNGISSLAAGSDDPVGVNLQPGDSFSWNIQAIPNAYWQVDTGGGFFPLMAFFTVPGAARTGDYTLDLSLAGSSVYSESQTGSMNWWVHVGTNTVYLDAGLKFDDMHLNYTLTSAFLGIDDPANPGTTIVSDIPADTNLQGQLPIFGAPELNQFSPGISFTGAVPEPETYAMLLVGLGVLGFLSRRRKS